MKIKTINPVYMQTSKGVEAVENVDRYYNATGSSSQVLAFQKWANANGYTPRLVEDGISGPKTKAAFKKMGSAYASYLNSTKYTKLSPSEIFNQMNDMLVKAGGGSKGSAGSSGGSSTGSTTAEFPSTGGTGTGIGIEAKEAAKKVAEASAAAEAPKAGLWNKLDKTTKIVIIAGGAILLIGTIAAIVKSRKRTVIIKK